jgi:anion-transporting  ArsA/GET3 family ATPase
MHGHFQKVWLAQLELQVRLVKLVRMEKMAPMEKMDVMDQMEEMAIEAPRAFQQVVQVM